MKWIIVPDKDILVRTEGEGDITSGTCRLSEFRSEMFARYQAASNNTFVPPVFQYSQRCAATIETRQATRFFVCVTNKIEHVQDIVRTENSFFRVIYCNRGSAVFTVFR